MTEEQLAWDRITGDAYLADLKGQSLSELRQMREECEVIECELSYGRRLLQGRIDILADELGRRARGVSSTPADLVDRLPSILAEGPSGSRCARLVKTLAPPRIQALEAEIQGLLGMPLVDVTSESTDRVEAALEHLMVAEREVSKKRRSLHFRLDTIQAEMTRRYCDGEADVGSLLMGPE